MVVIAIQLDLGRTMLTPTFQSLGKSKDCLTYNFVFVIGGYSPYIFLSIFAYYLFTR